MLACQPLGICRACERSGKWSGAGRKSVGAERSGAKRGAGVVEKRWSGSGAVGRRSGTEQEAGVTEISWSAERLFRCSRSAHMLWASDIILPISFACSLHSVREYFFSCCTYRHIDGQNRRRRCSAIIPNKFVRLRVLGPAVTHAL